MKYRLIKWYKKRIGKFPLDDQDCCISAFSTFVQPENLRMGRWVFMGSKCFIEAKGNVIIEDGCIFSSRVTILSSSHNYICTYSIPYGEEDVKKMVHIKRGVWIGYGALIMPGVTIGDGAIVGAGSVVTKDVEPGVIVGGNPAKEINRRRGSCWFELIENNEYRIRKKLNC